MRKGGTTEKRLPASEGAGELASLRERRWYGIERWRTYVSGSGDCSLLREFLPAQLREVFSPSVTSVRTGASSLGSREPLSEEPTLVEQFFQSVPEGHHNRPFGRFHPAKPDFTWRYAIFHSRKTISRSRRLHSQVSFGLVFLLQKISKKCSLLGVEISYICLL